MRVLPCFLLPGLLAGCITVGPDYQPPAPALPAQWHNATPDAAAAQLAQWWQQFDDPTLDSLIARVLASSPDLRSAEAKLRESRQRAVVAGAARLPSVGASASARRSESAGAGSASDSYSAGFDASWEVDVFGGTRRSVEAAAATLAATEASLDDARVSLVAEVAKNYIELRSLQHRLGIARSNLASQVETEQTTRWRHQAGLVSELDKAQAASNLAQTRARLPALESSLEASRYKLAVLVGEPRERVVSLVGEDGAIPRGPAVLAVSIPAETLRQRPDLRAAERRLAAQTASIGVAEAARYPAFRLSGNIGLSATQFAELWRTDALAGSLLASISSTLFDGGRLRANVRIQEAVGEQVLIAYEKAVAQAVADVETALAALARGGERLAQLQIAADTGREAEAIARQRYAAGLIDFTAVLDAQRSLLSLEDTLASAQADQATALVQLYKALGGGWEAAPTTGALRNE